MTEKQPRKKQERTQPSERERRITFSEVTIAAWTGEIRGQHLADPNSPYRQDAGPQSTLVQRHVSIAGGADVACCEHSIWPIRPADEMYNVLEFC